MKRFYLAVLLLAVLGSMNAFAGTGKTYDDPIWLLDGNNPALTFDQTNGVWYSYKVPPYCQTTIKPTYTGFSSIAYFTTTEEDAKNAVHKEEDSFRNGSYPWSYMNLSSDSVQIWMQLMYMQAAQPAAQALTVTTVAAEGCVWNQAIPLSDGDNSLFQVEEGGDPRWYRATVPTGNTATLNPCDYMLVNIYIGESDAEAETNAKHFRFGTKAYSYENTGDEEVVIYVKLTQTSCDEPVINLLTQYTAGIDDVNVNADVDSRSYNIAGQRVDASTKGIIIKNHKKILNK